MQVFPHHILYPPKKRTYKVGDYFQVECYNGLSRLVQVGGNEVCLISPRGGWHMDPISVGDLEAITEDEMDRLTVFDYMPVDVAEVVYVIDVREITPDIDI